MNALYALALPPLSFIKFQNIFDLRIRTKQIIQTEILILIFNLKHKSQFSTQIFVNLFRYIQLMEI